MRRIFQMFLALVASALLCGERRNEKDEGERGDNK